MKKLFVLCMVFVFSFCSYSVSFAETTTEDVIEALKLAYSEAFDYCETRYNADDSTLIVDVAIDGFAQIMYQAKENGVESTDETWNQLKGIFLAAYYGSVSMFETCEIETPKHIHLQLWNDDVVIRNDHSTGKSRILLAIQNGYFYIDEMESY